MRNYKLRISEKEEEQPQGGKLLKGISDFFFNNRKILIIVAAVLLAGLAVLGGILVGTDKKQDKLQVRASDLQEREEKLFQGEYTPEDYAKLIEDLEALRKEGKKSYAGLKAGYVLGLSYLKAEDYQNAYASFMDVYKSDPKSYLSALSVFNAAVAKDNLGETDAALELYEKVPAEFGYDNGAAPRALFNSARIHLQKGDIDLAKATFQQIIDRYPGSEYVALSKNAILPL